MAFLYLPFCEKATTCYQIKTTTLKPFTRTLGCLSPLLLLLLLFYLF